MWIKQYTHSLHLKLKLKLKKPNDGEEFLVFCLLLMRCDGKINKLVMKTKTMEKNNQQPTCAEINYITKDLFFLFLIK